jgi:hypothetical protein
MIKHWRSQYILERFAVAKPVCYQVLLISNNNVNETDFININK